jgi:hypothetical protein
MAHGVIRGQGLGSILLGKSSVPLGDASGLATLAAEGRVRGSRDEGEAGCENREGSAHGKEGGELSEGVEKGIEGTGPVGVKRKRKSGKSEVKEGERQRLQVVSLAQRSEACIHLVTVRRDLAPPILYPSFVAARPLWRRGPCTRRSDRPPSAIAEAGCRTRERRVWMAAGFHEKESDGYDQTYYCTRNQPPGALASNELSLIAFVPLVALILQSYRSSRK